MANSKKALGILFAVKGGSSVSQGSGALILSDLKKIVNQINNNNKLMPKIKLQFDTSTLQTDLHRLKKDLGEIAKIAKEIQVGSQGGGSGKRSGGGSVKGDSEEYRTLTKNVNEYTKALIQMQRIQMKNYSIHVDENGVWSGGGKAYARQIKEINDLRESLSGRGISLKADGTFQTDERELTQSFKQGTLSAQEYHRIVKQINEAEIRVGIANEKNGNTIQSTWDKNATKVQEYIARNRDTISQNKEILKELNKVDHLARTGDPNDLDELTKKFEELRAKIRESGADVETWGQKFSRTMGGKVRSVLAGIITTLASQAVYQVYRNVVNLDKAVVNLQIASGKTRKEVQDLTRDYAELGKQLGATTSEIANSADTWLRQGYTAKEAETLITNSTMLSKLGQLEAADASKALTSSMKGYKVAVQDSVEIVDKLTAVDMEAAASAGDIATAMAETAASANIAGVGMDKLIGYLTIVKEVTQDGAESVGTFYRTLFARMNNVKIGKFVDDETGESLNDVEATLKSVGISLRDDNEQFRNSSDVLDEVGAKWQNFDSVAKHAIATAFAGTRQQEKFIVLMENYGAAIEYAKVATEASGTATEKYGAYLSGIDGHMNALVATIEKLSMTVLDSGLITGVLSAATKTLEVVINITEALGGLNSVLVITIGLLSVKGLVSVVGKISEGITKAGKALTRFQHILSITKATGAGTTGAIALGFKELVPSITSAQLAIGAFGVALSIAVFAFSAYNNHIEKTIQKNLDAANSAREAAEEHRNAAETIEKLADKYEELSRKNDGVFDSSTASEVQGIQDQITKLVGDQAKNLDLVNGALDKELLKLKGISLEQQKLMKDNAQVALANTENAYQARVHSLTLGEAGLSWSGKEYLIQKVEDLPLEANKYIKRYGVDTGTTDMRRGWELETQYESMAAFVEQYKNVLAMRNALAKDYGDTQLYIGANQFVEDFKALYDSYTSASSVLAEIDRINQEAGSSSGNGGDTVLLKSINDVLKEVQPGFDGLTEALSSVTAEGYLTADALSKILTLSEENALGGVKLADILEHDAHGYILSKDALQQYIDALLNAAMATEVYASAQDKENAIENLKTLRRVFATLAATQNDVTDSIKAQREQLDKQKDAYDDRLDAYRDLIDLRKDLIQSYKDELDYQDELNKKQMAVSSLQTKLSVARLDTSAAGRARARELEDELRKAQEELDDFTLEHAIDVLTQELDNQYTEYESFIKQKLNEIEDLLSGLDKDTDVNITVDTTWMSGMMEKIDKAIETIANRAIFVKAEDTGPILKDIVGTAGLLQHVGKWNIYESDVRQSIYHSGGLVGGLSTLSTSEEFAKLLKGEFVSTPAQMKRFMEKTLPEISSYGNSKNTNEFNAPLIALHCDSVTEDSLPQLKQIVNEAVKEVKKHLDSGLSRTGFKKPVVKPLI